jgi:hypothetical protein
VVSSLQLRRVLQQLHRGRLRAGAVAVADQSRKTFSLMEALVVAAAAAAAAVVVVVVAATVAPSARKYRLAARQPGTWMPMGFL